MPDAAALYAGLREAMFWAPDWLAGAMVLVLAALTALAVHRLIYAASARAFSERRPFVHAILQRIKGPLALALVAFALATALQSTPFSPQVSARFGRLLLIA